MEINKKTMIVGVFAMLLIGVSLVSASSYYSMNELHNRMISSDGFEEMHNAMMNGDFAAVEKYHKTLDFDCPMHDLVKKGDVSLENFQKMHEWLTQITRDGIVD